LQLGVPLHLLKAIEGNTTHAMERLVDMLEYWMRNATDPPPSWRALIDALRAPTIGETRLAGELEVTYYNQTEQGKSVQ